MMCVFVAHKKGVPLDALAALKAEVTALLAARSPGEPVQVVLGVDDYTERALGKMPWSRWVESIFDETFVGSRESRFNRVVIVGLPEDHAPGSIEVGKATLQLVRRARSRAVPVEVLAAGALHSSGGYTESPHFDADWARAGRISY